MKLLIQTIFFCFFMGACTETGRTNHINTGESKKLRVIFDSDANNELDDQHALAYLLFNNSFFNTIGVTVNATFNGGDIMGHYQEAKRVLQLCVRDQDVPVFKGANKNFTDIQNNIGLNAFDGKNAVDFIISQAKDISAGKLILIAVGKLTNVALAVKKDPGIVSAIRLVWLGSNYPESGEYNMINDTSAMNYLLNTPIQFELVPARYGKTTGTDYVKAAKLTIDSIMPGLGPKVNPVTGRHDTALTCFGDYSVNLFQHAEMYGNPPSRALFDMAAVAIVKNELWATKNEIPCPALINGNWVAQPTNNRKIFLWENFDRDKILGDFFTTMKNAK
jgi:hypothetical protein